jgi:hypothetical protein
MRVHWEVITVLIVHLTSVDAYIAFLIVLGSSSSPSYFTSTPSTENKK